MKIFDRKKNFSDQNSISKYFFNFDDFYKKNPISNIFLFFKIQKSLKTQPFDFSRRVLKKNK